MVHNVFVVVVLMPNMNPSSRVAFSGDNGFTRQERTSGSNCRTKKKRSAGKNTSIYSCTMSKERRSEARGVHEVLGR
jgi:hypothetical protein